MGKMAAHNEYCLKRENYFQGLIYNAHIVLFQFAPHPGQSQAIVNRTGLQAVGDGLLVKSVYRRRCKGHIGLDSRLLLIPGRDRHNLDDGDARMINIGAWGKIFTRIQGTATD